MFFFNYKLNGLFHKQYYPKQKVLSYNISLAPDYFRLLSLPNKQYGKYNEMDPILIDTAVYEHVIREMSKPAVPLVKALWHPIIFINIHEYVMNTW